ncbi:MAG: aryl-sulfate sulfotransferase [Cyclobacteriaceae bacterium]|nr:aryl-sulfate sulfotransferase [Cyclobacteriaceae bacterium]
MKLRLLGALLGLISFSSTAQKIAGLLDAQLGVQEGYVLYNPTNYNKAYLIDGCGRVVNTWTSQYAAAHTIYLKKDGTLVRTNLLTNTVIDGGGGSGGGVEILDWNSNVLWAFAYNTDLVRQHHDIQVLPSGNILILAWEKKTTTQAIDAGRDPGKLPNNQLWPEHLVEVRQTGPTTGEIVWEWHVWDHLIQDFDNTKPNYGVVGDHPELIDLNFTVDGQKDWIHANALDYNPELDQIIISAHAFNELWIIDHSTTSAQAASHSGGRSGKGGDLLYRWGNPMAYRQGTANDTKLMGQHHTHWITKELPQAGRIMYFNNAPLRFYSSVEIIDPPLNPNGTYTLTAGKFGPANPSSIYTSTPQSDLFSKNMSSAQMLVNGNLFIGSAAQGIATEVTPTNQVIWKYKSPVTVNGIVGRTDPTTNAAYTPRPVFRMIKYPYNYPAFIGRTLTPQEPVEGAPWADCGLVTGLEEKPVTALAYPNPANDRLTVTAPGCFNAVIMDGQGRKVFEGPGEDQLVINTSSISPGLYLLRVGKRVEKVVVRH